MIRIHGPREESRYLDRWEESTVVGARDSFVLPGDTKQWLRDRVVDVKHIKVTCSFDLPLKQVLGEVELTLSPIIDGVERVELDSADTEVKSVTYGRQSLDFTHSDDLLMIDLPHKVNTGNEFKLTIEYVSTPRQGIYFTGPDKGYPDKSTQVWTQGQDTDNHHWFPCIDEPKGRITSEIICTVPSDWTVVSNGRLVSDNENRGGGTRTVHWLQDKPHAVYLVTLVAGQFSRVVMQEKNPLIDFYCAPGREEDARRAFENTPAMIKLYEELFGEPYPWDKYTQVAVQDFIFGGMENTSATTQTDLTLHDEKAHKDFSSDFLVSHEAVHQWFGDLMTCREWAHGWLNEGFATFFEAVWQEHHRGEDEYLYDVLGMARGYLGEKYRRPIVERQYNQPVDIFDRHLYEKGGTVLHMLRRELGDDLFYRAIRHYVQQNKGRNVLTVDLQRAIEETTGRNMDWFFDQWVYSAGHPNFKVSYSWDNESKSAVLSVRQTQKEVFRCSVTVAFATSAGRQEFRANLTEKEHTLTYFLPDRPKMVAFDSGFGVLKTIDFKRPKDMLIHQLKNDTDSVGRISAAQALGKETSADSIRALKQALNKDTFWGVQVTAARALGEIRTEAAREALVSSIWVENLKARRGVAEALGRFKNDTKAARALIRLLQSEDSYYVSGTAASSLGATKAKPAHEALVGSLDRDSHMEVIRAGAINGLGQLETDEAREVVLRWTEWGRPQRARIAATSALGTLGHEHKPTVERLVELVDDGWFQVKMAAMRSLEKLKAQEALPALRRTADRELDGRVVRTARETVKAIRAGSTTNDDVKKLRDDMSKLEDENRGLKERLDKLEAQVKKAADGSSSTSRSRRRK